MPRARGIYARFLAQNGYPGEVERAIKEGLIKGRRYLITACSISQSSSRVTVRGRSYNSVLFDVTVERLIKKWGDPYRTVRNFVKGNSPDLNPQATAEGRAENCPDCGQRVRSIFDHVDGCPKQG